MSPRYGTCKADRRGSAFSSHRCRADAGSVRALSVPRDEVAKALAATPTELDSSTSLYSRVLDEEIVLEENVDEDAGIRNVIFVYDRFSGVRHRVELLYDGAMV